MDERLKELQELLRAQYGIDVNEVLAAPRGQLPPMFDGGTFEENIPARRPEEPSLLDRALRVADVLRQLHPINMSERIVKGVLDATSSDVAPWEPPVYAVTEGGERVLVRPGGLFHTDPTEIFELAASLVPGPGTVLAARDAVRDFSEGRPISGLLNAVSVPLDLVGMGGAPRAVAAAGRGALAASRGSKIAAAALDASRGSKRVAKTAANIDDVTDRLIETALANPSGFTIDPFTGAAHTVDEGRYIVAPSKKTELPVDVIGTGADQRPVIDRAKVREWVEQHWDALKEGKAGGWFDEETNRFVFDVSRGYNDLDEALEVAIRGKQDGIFDLATFETIRTPSAEEFARDRGRRQRALRPRVTEEMLAEPTPSRGIYPKPPQGTNKSTPLPSLDDVRERMAQTEAAVRRAEIEQGGRRWAPVERGIFDRSQQGLLRSGNTLPEATGRPNPLLGELLDNPRLMRLLERQVNLGLGRGGESFYDLSPIAASYGEMGGPVSFRDFVAASSAGSVQSPLPLEASNASILLYAMRNGISYDDAARELMRRYPQAAAPWFNRTTHGGLFDRYRETGTIDPPSPASGARKVPSYFRQKLGETGAEAPVTGRPTATIDTHESKAILHPIGAERWAENVTGAEYNQIEDMIYRPLARRIGVPEEAVQAGRWLGGGSLTGLLSPMGDYVQGLEDVLYWSAQQMGRGTDPASLRDYWRAVAQGEDFVLPFYGKGGVPIPNSGGLLR